MAGTLRELMQRAMKGTKTTRFADTSKIEFSLDDFPTTTAFAKRLSVEQVTHGTHKKVVLGFFVKSEKTFLELKINVGFKWLQENKIFLCTQNLSFEHGTDLSLIGYYILDHPRFGKAELVVADILHSWAEATNDPDNDEDNQKIKQMAKEGIIERGEVINIPLTVERNKMTVKPPTPNKSPFPCDVWHVYVPRKYYKQAVFLNDLAILDAKTLTTMIPQALAKSNMTDFYHQMTKHAKYMHEHRNITIYNVPPENYKKNELLMDGIDKQHTSLYAKLDDKETIYHVYNDQETNSINLSMNVKHYAETFEWLRKLLPKFSYGPQVKSFPTTRTRGSSSKDRYSRVFSVNNTDDGSFDPSTIASVKSRNPWNRAPPMELVFDVTNSDEFPTLPTANIASPVSQSGSNPMSIQGTQDIKTIVAKAIAEQQNDFNKQLEQLRARNMALEESLKKLTEKIENDIGKMAERTVEALMGPTCPFFTKEDAAIMLKQQNQTHSSTQNQLDKILSILHKTQLAQEESTMCYPPRKSARKDDTANTQVIRHSHEADQIMTDARHEEVGRK